MAGIDETFFTTVGCMDGRVQGAIAVFGQETLGAEFPDTITEAGMVGLLAKDEADGELLKSIRFKLVDVSINKHKSRGVLVHGHQECAGNPVNDEKHMQDILKATKVIRIMVSAEVSVYGLFVSRSYKGWIAKVIER